MYCSHCGSSTADDLNFCKNCGSRNERLMVRDDTRVRGLALSAAGAVGVFGIGGFYFVLSALLVNSLITPGYVLLIMVAYLLAILTMFSIFVRIARRDSDRGSSNRQTDNFSYQPPPHLRPAKTAQLNESHEHPASVTEVTTRSLDEVAVRER